MTTTSLRRLVHATLIAAGVVSASAPQAAAQNPGTVIQTGKISSFLGAFGGQLSDQDQFGDSVAPLGDLDGDGVDDIVVGAPFDDDGANGAGAVWILFLTPSSTVKAFQKISMTEGGFGGTLGSFDRFGASVAALGDVDGDGITDLAVGAPNDDDGGPTIAANSGAVWILRLDTDGTVLAESKLSATAGGLAAVFGDEPLVEGDRFGVALANIGDIDGDGRDELAVGADGDSDGGFFADTRGAVYVLRVDPDLDVSSGRKISDKEGNFSETSDVQLEDFDRFGSSVAPIGDVNLDGISDVAVGAPGRDEGGSSRGGVFVLYMAPDLTVRGSTFIAQGEGGFASTLDDSDALGTSVVGPGDLNDDGVPDLIVGAPGDDDVAGGGVNGGALWVMFLDLDGLVIAEQKISDLTGGFVGAIGSDDRLGTSLARLDAGTANGIPKILTGAIGDDDGGSSATADRGAVWLLSLAGTVGTPNWTWLAEGVAGTDGLLPRLGGDGPLTFMSTTTIRLFDAKPNAISTLVLSASAINVPFKGGTLVPLPTVTTGFVLGDDGFLELVAEMPEDVPVGVSLYLQYFIGDTAAPFGFASTNGLRGTRE